MLRITKVLVALLLVTGGQCGCPPSSAISPCTCKDVMAGRTLDCASVSTGQKLATIMENDMGDPKFTFLQVIKSNGRAPLNGLVANTFADKTFSHIWIGDNDMETVDQAAFTGLEDNLLDMLIGSSPSLSSFPFSSLETMSLLTTFKITSSAINRVTSFGAAPTLAHIEVTDAEVKTIASDAFNDLPNLASVDLGGNLALNTLGDRSLAASTQQPWSVYLDKCSIGHVSDTAFAGTLPLTVYLRGNSLTTVTESAFGAVLDNMVVASEAGGSVGGLNIDANPLTCGCDLAWLATDAARMAVVKHASCAAGDVAGVALEDLPTDHFADC